MPDKRRKGCFEDVLCLFLPQDCEKKDDKPKIVAVQVTYCALSVSLRFMPLTASVFCCYILSVGSFPALSGKLKLSTFRL